MNVGDRVRSRRMELGLSVAELASRAGLSRSYLYQLENGTRPRPTAAALSRIASQLNTTVDGLMAAHVAPPRKAAVTATSFDKVSLHFESKHIKVTDQLLQRFHAAVQANHFAILAGVQGSGKSLLAVEYSNSIEAEYCIVPLHSSMREEDILGYYDPSSRIYHDTPISTLLRKASKERSLAASQKRGSRSFVIILDEMNRLQDLSPISRLVSVAEDCAQKGEAEITLEPGRRLRLPATVYLIGTANVRRTPSHLQGEIYERAAVIDLSLSRDAILACIGDVPYREVLMQVWDLMRDVAPFAYSTIKAIHAYVDYRQTLGATVSDALDEALVQSVFPRLPTEGRDAARVLRLLAALTEDGLRLSHSFISQTLETAEIEESKPQPNEPVPTRAA